MILIAANPLVDNSGNVTSLKLSYCTEIKKLCKFKNYINFADIRAKM